MYNKLTTSQATYLNFLRGFSAIIVLAGHTLSGIPGVISFGKQLPFQSLAVNAFFLALRIFNYISLYNKEALYICRIHD